MIISYFTHRVKNQNLGTIVQKMMKIRLLIILFLFVIINLLIFEKGSFSSKFVYKKINNSYINVNNNLTHLIIKNSLWNVQSLLIIAFVTISPSSFEHRNLIRHTWANKTLFPQIKTVFILGLSSNNTVNEMIKLENEVHQDIVQENFMDTYNNLTLKTIAGFKWVSKYCSKAKFALKIDDDVVVNTPVLIDFIQKTVNKGNYSNQYIGSLMINAKVIYDKSYKWYVNENEFNSTYYPLYNQGPAYMMSTKLARDFYNLSLSTPLFRFEDVYVGILAEKLKYVDYVSIGYLYIFQNAVSEIQTSQNNNKLFAFTSVTDFNNVWKAFMIKNRIQ